MLINVMPIRKHVFFSLPFFLLVSSTELRLQVTFVAICSRGIWGNFIFIIAAAKLLKELAIMKEKTGIIRNTNFASKIRCPIFSSPRILGT